MKKLSLNNIFLYLAIISILLAIITWNDPVFSIDLPMFYALAILCILVQIIFQTHLIAFISCFNCQGSGSVEYQNPWQKKINYFIPGLLGKKCPICKGLGRTKIIEELSQDKLIGLKNKHKQVFGKEYPIFNKYIKKGDQ